MSEREDMGCDCVYSFVETVVVVVESHEKLEWRTRGWNLEY